MHFEVQAGKVLVNGCAKVRVRMDLVLDVEAVARKKVIKWMHSHFV